MGSKVPLPWPWAARLPLQEKCHNFFVYWPIFDLKPGKFAHVHGASSGYLRLRKPLQVGGVDPRVIYLFRVRSAEVHGARHRVAASLERCVLAAAQSAPLFLGGGHRVRALPI